MSIYDLAKIMKNRIIIFLAIIFHCILGCKNGETKNIIDHSILEKEDVNNNTPIFSKGNFDKIYKYASENSNQILGIKIISNRKIEFHLVTKTLPCDTEYWGIAEGKYSDLASEVDENTNRTEYRAVEYINNDKKYNISLKMALDCSKVQINYSQENNLGTDCLPITGKVMKRIK